MSGAARASRTLEIHQFDSILQPWDAVGSHVLGVHQALLPFLPPSISAQPDPKTLAALTAGRTWLHLIFDDRPTSHKGHVQLVWLLALVREAIDPGARHFPRRLEGPAICMHLLARRIDRLTAGAVVLTGPVSDGQLAAYYAQADMFICLSEHEGLGLPLIEAVRAQVHAFAYDAGAVGETMHDAGVLARRLEPAALAGMVAIVAADEDLQAELRERQAARAAGLENFPRERALLGPLGGRRA